MAGLGWVVRTIQDEGPIMNRLRSQRRAVRQVLPPEGRFPGDPYIGSHACAECHPGEYALYQRSGHARTFRLAHERALSSQLDGVRVADPEWPGVSWAFSRKDGEFWIERNDDGRVERFVVDYVFGSGAHASTFVTLADLAGPRAIEHRITHYRHEGKLGITPGQGGKVRAAGTQPWGRELSPRTTIKCFRCHTTELSSRGDSEIDPATMIPNVACERCHGPGRRHVELARSGAGEEFLSMPMGSGSWTADSQLELCAKCHRDPNLLPPEIFRPGDPQLARFQPIGITQSRCFQRSEGALSCLNCHDPHARSSTDTARYEQVCLGCHGGQPGVGRESVPLLFPAEPSAAPLPLEPSPGGESDSRFVAAGGVGARGDGEGRRPGGESDSRFVAAGPRLPDRGSAVCPVSPSRGCVSCHMPQVDSGQNILFTDHWIRVP